MPFKTYTHRLFLTGLLLVLVAVTACWNVSGLKVSQAVFRNSTLKKICQPLQKSGLVLRKLCPEEREQMNGDRHEGTPADRSRILATYPFILDRGTDSLVLCRVPDRIQGRSPPA